MIHNDFLYLVACDCRSERGEDVPRIKRPRQIQILCSTSFYGKREAKFQSKFEKSLSDTRSISAISAAASFVGSAQLAAGV